MKKLAFIAILAFSVMSVFAAGSKEEAKTLNVISYSSFADEWGAGPEIIKGFEEKTGLKVNLINGGSSSEVINHIESNFDTATLDVVVGIGDEYIEGKVKNYLDKPEVFDYSYYAFLVDAKSSIRPPKSLSDLLKPEYKKEFILIDPRTSVVGLGLLYWTASVFDDHLAWWEKALDNALTTASSWSEAYGLFLEGEAPIVLSYITSPLYDIFNGDEPFGKSLEFKEGHIRCEEYMAVLKNSKNKKDAAKFIEYMKSDEAQQKLAKTNVMYPIKKDSLKEAFEYVKEPSKVVEKSAIPMDVILDDWTKELI